MGSTVEQDRSHLDEQAGYDGERGVTDFREVKRQPRRSRSRERKDEDLVSDSSGDGGVNKKKPRHMPDEAPPDDGLPVPQESCEDQAVSAVSFGFLLAVSSEKSTCAVPQVSETLGLTPLTRVCTPFHRMQQMCDQMRGHTHGCSHDMFTTCSQSPSCLQLSLLVRLFPFRRLSFQSPPVPLVYRCVALLFLLFLLVAGRSPSENFDNVSHASELLLLDLTPPTVCRARGSGVFGKGSIVSR